MNICHIWNGPQATYELLLGASLNQRDSQKEYGYTCLIWCGFHRIFHHAEIVKIRHWLLICLFLKTSDSLPERNNVVVSKVLMGYKIAYLIGVLPLECWGEAPITAGKQTVLRNKTFFSQRALVKYEKDRFMPLYVSIFLDEYPASFYFWFRVNSSGITMKHQLLRLNLLDVFHVRPNMGISTPSFHSCFRTQLGGSFKICPRCFKRINIISRMP